MKTLNQWRSFCKSLINKSLLKLTALNKVFLSAVVLCLALLSAPVASAAETPELNSGISYDGSEMMLMAIAPSIRPPQPGISPGPARQASVMSGKMGRTGGAAVVEASVTYSIGDYDSTSCTSPATDVGIDDCEAAATALSKSYVGNDDNSNFPYGCIHYASNGSVRWNVATANNSYAAMAPVCVTTN